LAAVTRIVDGFVKFAKLSKSDLRDQRRCARAPFA
jgi:hypothetical protein